MPKRIIKTVKTPKIQKNIGDRLRVLRKCNSLTQQDVADFLGVDRTTYAKYELGNSQMSYETLTKLSTLFNEDYNTILCYGINFIKERT